MTTYKMNFDFTDNTERQVLIELQEQGFVLLGYKGARGPSQIPVGAPTWLTVPFGNIFSVADIQYTPRYRLYATNQSNIAVGTVIEMRSQSNELNLGGAMTFNPDGTFVSGGVGSVPSDSIGLYNSRPAGTPPLTVGLASEVATPSGRSFLPFCAFTLNPQNSIIMTPLENILLVAARMNLSSGNVQASVAAPGCNFSFNNQVTSYDLLVQPSSFALTNRSGTAPVSSVPSGSVISQIVNKS